MPIIAWLTSKLTSQIALPLLGGLLLLNIGTGVGLALTRHTLALRTQELSSEKLAHQADLANVKAQTAQAQADDKEHALAVKEAQDKISLEKENDLQAQLASARTIAANFVRSQAGKAGRSGGGPTPVSTNPDTSSQSDSAPASAVVSASDIDACAIDYTIAKGWQDWWKAQQIVQVSVNIPKSFSDQTLIKRSNEPAFGIVSRIPIVDRHFDLSTFDAGTKSLAVSETVREQPK